MHKNLIEDYKFVSPIRVPRSVLNEPASPQARLIARWAERIADMASNFGPDVELYQPDHGFNRFTFCGNEGNTSIAANLFRKAVIEMCNDSFDAMETLDFAEAKFNEFKRGPVTPKLPSCRVDLKVSPDDMDRKQRSSFENLSKLFGKIGVNIARVENRPTVIELSTDDHGTLKAAKLTAEWAAKSIDARHEITKNRLTQAFGTQSVQAVGRENGTRIAKLAYV